MIELGSQPKTRGIELSALARIVNELFEEALSGPPEPNRTRFVDNEPSSGFIGVLGGLSAEEASRAILPPDPISVAAHARHVLYCLSLGNQEARGEDSFAKADWAGSWRPTTVSEHEWSDLLASLRKEYEILRDVIISADGPAWKDEEVIGSILSQVAHGAWHLGAIRQGLGLVRAPRT